MTYHLYHIIFTKGEISAIISQLLFYQSSDWLDRTKITQNKYKYYRQKLLLLGFKYIKQT